MDRISASERVPNVLLVRIGYQAIPTDLTSAGGR
jgi:hypothetical protein